MGELSYLPLYVVSVICLIHFWTLLSLTYFPLSDLDVESGTVKDIAYRDTLNFGQLGVTYSAYVSVSDGILWAGNFYSASPLSPALAKMGFIGKDWVWKPNDEYFNAILGYKLSGDSSEEEWAALESIKDNASNVVNVDNTMDCIQGISFRKLDDDTYKMYLSRTTGGSLGAAITAATGLDGLTHAIEAYIGNPADQLELTNSIMEINYQHML